jgi:23S rRNA (pseudouridine1915-N3)-methyltransferase
MPHWVVSGYEEYARRLTSECHLRLLEVAPAQRGRKVVLKHVLQEEGKRMLKTIPKGSRVVALDVLGNAWSTEQLSEHLKEWMASGRDLSLLIGGPEGISPDCIQQAEMRWSLSALTLPHPLVRVVVAEQLYRAWSLLHNHPYHRAG